MPQTTPDLAFCRQFFLGTEYPAILAAWRRYDIGPQLKLSVHPGLAVAEKSDGVDSLTLLGFALDASEPQSRTTDILHQLWSMRGQPMRLRACTDRLGGRWVLIVHSGGTTWLIHDATGARQVSYGRLADGIVCASQAALIAYLYDLAVDPEAQAFVRARGASDLDVYWLPGDRTLYPEVRALLPNHALDLGTGKASRTWPVDTRRLTTDTAGAVDRCHAMLTGFMLAAQAQSSGLAVPMTAGWDSRLVFAMCWPISSDLYCYTFVYPNQSRTHRDVAVPARLLKRLGVEHHVLDYPHTIDPELRAISRQSTYNGHDGYCADVQVLLKRYPAGRLCLTGDAAEVVKCHFRLGNEHTGPVTPSDLAVLCGLPVHPFALAAFQDWLASVPEHLPIPLLDLFCWEQMAGRWQAMIRAEYDVVQESLAPLNCRALLLDMLSIDERERSRPDFPIIAEMIKRFCPEALDEPINPPERDSLAYKAVRAVGRLKLHRLLPEHIRDKLRILARSI